MKYFIEHLLALLTNVFSVILTSRQGSYIDAVAIDNALITFLHYSAIKF